MSAFLQSSVNDAVVVALLAADKAQRVAGVTQAMRDGRRTPRLLFEGVGGE